MCTWSGLEITVLANACLLPIEPRSWSVGRERAVVHSQGNLQVQLSRILGVKLTGSSQPQQRERGGYIVDIFLRSE